MAKAHSRVRLAIKPGPQIYPKGCSPFTTYPPVTVAVVQSRSATHRDKQVALVLILLLCSRVRPLFRVSAPGTDFCSGVSVCRCAVRNGARLEQGRWSSAGLIFMSLNRTFSFHSPRALHPRHFVILKSVHNFRRHSHRSSLIAHRSCVPRMTVRGN